MTLPCVRRMWMVVAVVGLLAGCEVGDIRRPAPIRSSALRETHEVRRAVVPVPRDFSLQIMSFWDSRFGYALYTHGDNARLLSTVDGGRSWTELRHPRPVADQHEMIVGDAGALLLLAEPHGWYGSTDGGRTHRYLGRSRNPLDEYYELLGRYHVDDSGRVVEYAHGRRRVMQTKPPLASQGMDVAYDPSGRLWVAGRESGRPVAALTTDGGRTWRRHPVPGPVGWLVGAWLEMSAGGGDVWLLGQPETDAFPRVWRFNGSDWQEWPTDGNPGQFRAAAAVGDGVLAISWSGGGGLLGPAGYTPCDWPLGSTYLRVLADGTVMAGDAAASGVFLGQGHGVNRRWVKVVATQT